jgi:small membrane protein
MIFQILATLVLSGVAIYAYSQSRMAPKVTAFVFLLVGLGEYLVLAPDHAISIAHFFGIGRGADLVFYLWILLSLVVVLNLHLKIRSSNERFVSLIRTLALKEAAEMEVKRVPESGSAAPKVP